MTPASGAAVVVVGHNGWLETFLGIVAIPTSEGTFYSIAVEDSADAEAVAVCAAINIAWHLGHAHYNIRYDAKTVGGAASGSQNWNSPNAEVVRGLGMLLETKANVQWRHVHGHTGNGWNELADTAAKGAACGNGAGSTGSQFPIAWTSHPLALQWLWYASYTNTQLSVRGLPLMQGHAVTCPSNFDNSAISACLPNDNDKDEVRQSPSMSGL